MVIKKQLYLKKLEAAGLSNTSARYLLFEVLDKFEHNPVSLSVLLKETNGIIDRASVYRNIKVLEEAGIVQKLRIGWKYKLELSDDFHGHHHHITCTICGETHATHDDDGFEQAISALASKHGYKLTEHTIDMHGVCLKCQKNRTR